MKNLKWLTVPGLALILSGPLSVFATTKCTAVKANTLAGSKAGGTSILLLKSMYNPNTDMAQLNFYNKDKGEGFSIEVIAGDYSQSLNSAADWVSIKVTDEITGVTSTSRGQYDRNGYFEHIISRQIDAQDYVYLAVSCKK